MRSVPAMAVAACVMLCPGALPLEAANREQEQMMADLRMLQQQTQELQVLLGRLSESIKAVNSRLDEQEAEERKAFADQKLLVNNLSGDLRIVREKVDETNVRVGTLAQDIEGLRDLIPPRGLAPGPTDMTDPTDPAAAPDGNDAAPSDAPPAGPVAIGMSPTRLFEQAYADYAAGQYPIAISGFEMYLKTYPRSEKADDAQYYIGEAHANAKSHNDAVTAYQRVIQDYPESDKLPEAWYKVGISYDNLGQPDRARAAFEHVVKTFPESTASALAKQGLDRLNRRTR